MLLKNIYRNNSISLLLMIIISLVTQILTIMKTSIVAGSFGLSIEMDAYNFANSIVSLIFGLIASGIPTIVIPNYVKKTNRKYIDSFLTFTYGILLISILIISIFRYQIIGTFSNKEEIFVNITCNILLLLFFAQYLMSITNVIISFFQCNGKYNIPKIINLLSQLIVVFFLIIMKHISIYQYTIIISLGIIINFALDLIIALKHGWKYNLAFEFKNQEVKKMLKMFLPIVFSSSIYNISLFFDSAIASRLPTGNLSILSYSNQITGIVNTVLIGNLIIYAYPKIIREIGDDKNQEKFWNQVHFFHWVVVLAIVGFYVVGKEGISLFFKYGQFNDYAVQSVFIGTALYLIGLQNDVIRDLIYRLFYAKGDTKSPARNSVLISILNISISLILVKIIGFYGIILGTIISSFISLIVIFIKCNNKYGVSENYKTIFIEYIKNIFIGCLTLIIVLITKHYLPLGNNLVAIILVYGIETVIVNTVLTYFFNRNTLVTLKKI